MGASAGDVGVLTTDRAMVVRSWDAWLADATGIPAEVASGRALVDLFPELAERGLISRLRRVADDGVVEVLAPAFHQYLIPCAPREPTAHFSRMQQHVTLAPLRAGEEIVGLTVTIRDVTARREHERRLASRLDSADEATRLQTVEALAAAEASPDVLVGAFDDASWRVRSAAVEGVARQQGEGVAEVLTRVLREQHRDLAVLNATLRALAATGEEVLPPLLELLRSPEADLRVYVALALGLRGDLRAVPPLVGALSDEDDNVRFHALEALGRLRARSAAADIVELAESGDFALSFAALDALAAIGDETVAPRLFPLLEDDLLRSAALAALGRLGGEEAVAPLTGLLLHEEAQPGEVAEALATIHGRYEEAFGDGEVIARLARATTAAEGGRRLSAALASARDSERAALVRVLGWLEVEGSTEALVEALRYPEARAAAVEGLVRIGAGAADALTRGLASLDDDALRPTAQALGRIGSPAAVPALLELLDAAPETAAAAADALGRIGDPRAFEPLLRLLDHPQAAVRQAGVGALNSIAHPAMRERLPELLGSPSPAVRESAARIAGYFGEFADPLLSLCGDPEESVRRAAVEHAVYLDDPRVLEALRTAIRTDTGAARAAAARALARLAPSEAAALLAEALSDADLWVRYYAARSAASLRLPPLSGRLEAMALRDPAVPVRIAAIEALGAIGAPSILPALCALADDADPELRLSALAALGRIEHPAALRVLAGALAADDPAVQRGAIDSLSRASAAALADEVARTARATWDAGVARAAARALLRAATAEAARALCALAAEPPLRDLAVQMLAALPDELRDVLGGELSTGDEASREAILAALAHGRIGGAERLAATALDDPSPLVRRAAAHTLCRLDLRATLAGR